MSEDIEMHYCDSCGGSYGYDESKNEKVYQNERNLEAALAKANKEVERLKAEVELLKAYYNPKDMSFKKMMDTFVTLSEAEKEKIIDLTQALNALSEVEK
jgi:Zn-finger nucleic acid-binding protein